MAEKELYEITNVSGMRGVVRTDIVISQGCVLKPANYIGRRRATSANRLRTLVVGVETLRRLVRYYQRRQMSVRKIGGGLLPSWLEGSSKSLAPSLNESTGSTPGPEMNEILDNGAREAIKALLEIKDPQVLEDMFKYEGAHKNRKTVLQAIEDQLDELAESTAGGSSDGGDDAEG